THVSWFDRIRDWWEESVRGAAPRPPSAPPTSHRRVGAPRRAARTPQQAASDSGSNPYDTYTWELQTGDDTERKLKRTADISRPKTKKGDKSNPYDTGSFNSPW